MENEPLSALRSPVSWKVRLRRIGIAAAGVLVTAIAGYLLAALVLFPAPFRSGARQVPHVMGMDENDARRQAERQGMTLDVSAREPHPTAPMGTVVWQEPPPGVAVARGFRIAVTMSTGMPRVAIPDVRGFDPAFAQRLLMAAGLGVDGVDSVDVVSMPSGLVAGTSPRGGDSVALGQRIMLQVTR